MGHAAATWPCYLLLSFINYFLPFIKQKIKMKDVEVIRELILKLVKVLNLILQTVLSV